MTDSTTERITGKGISVFPLVSFYFIAKEVGVSWLTVPGSTGHASEVLLQLADDTETVRHQTLHSLFGRFHAAFNVWSCSMCS